MEVRVTTVKSIIGLGRIGLQVPGVDSWNVLVGPLLKLSKSALFTRPATGRHRAVDCVRAQVDIQLLNRLNNSSPLKARSLLKSAFCFADGLSISR